MKWIFLNEQKEEKIENKISEIDKRVVMVSKIYLDKLKKNNIPYTIFTETANKCWIVKKGKKKKRFCKKQCDIIRQEKIDGKSYRELAAKYNCSTKTIYQILKNIY